MRLQIPHFHILQTRHWLLPRRQWRRSCWICRGSLLLGMPSASCQTRVRACRISIGLALYVVAADVWCCCVLLLFSYVFICVPWTAVLMGCSFLGIVMVDLDWLWTCWWPWVAVIFELLDFPLASLVEVWRSCLHVCLQLVSLCACFAVCQMLVWLGEFGFVLGD